MVFMSHWIFSTPNSTLSVQWFSWLFHKALHWEASWSFHWDTLGQSRSMKLFGVHGLDLVIPPFWRQLDVKFLSSFAISWVTPSEPQNSIFCLGSFLSLSEVSISCPQVGTWLRDGHEAFSQDFWYHQVLMTSLPFFPSFLGVKNWSELEHEGGKYFVHFSNFGSLGFGSC